MNHTVALEFSRMGSLRIPAGIDIRSLSFESLQEVTGGAPEMNQEVVDIILAGKKDVWNNPELFELVDFYFKNSFHMLDFCTELGKCLRTARSRQLIIISAALQRFEEEEGCSEVETKYSKTMEELRRFKVAEDPFIEEFFQILHRASCEEQLKKLKLHSGKINKKLRCFKRARKISSRIFWAIIVVVAIGSLFTAIFNKATISTALSAVVPLGQVRKWVDSGLKSHQIALEGRRELISSMEVRTVIAISDLQNIRVLVDSLELQIESLMKYADFALRGEDKVKFGVEEIKKNMDKFMQGLEDLGGHARKCVEDIMKGRKVMLQEIMKDNK